jgi:hypothetical protein
MGTRLAFAVHYHLSIIHYASRHHDFEQPVLSLVDGLIFTRKTAVF